MGGRLGVAVCCGPSAEAGQLARYRLKAPTRLFARDTQGEIADVVRHRWTAWAAPRVCPTRNSQRAWMSAHTKRVGCVSPEQALEAADIARTVMFAVLSPRT